MEEALETGDFAAYGTAQERARRSLDEDDARESSKHKPLSKRVRALDVRFAAQAGGHAAEIMEDGARTREASDDGLTAVKEALHACNQAAKATLSTDASGRAVELEEAYARYEKKLARARKVDARALRHVGKDADGLHDHALDFALCEAEVTAKRLDLEDRDPVERYERTSSTQCGYYEWEFAAPRLVGGGFGSFELDGVQEDNAYPYPCKKFPRKSKVPRALTGAIKEGIIVSPGEVLVMQGDFRVSETGDGVVKKFATVRHYSKKTKITTGECGESDPKIGCENNSSPTALRYNQVSHYSKRAAAHPQGRPCSSLQGAAQEGQRLRRGLGPQRGQRLERRRREVHPPEDDRRDPVQGRGDRRAEEARQPGRRPRAGPLVHRRRQGVEVTQLSRRSSCRQARGGT